MREKPRLFLFLVLILVLLTAACGAEEGTTPTSFAETLAPGDVDLTGTPFDVTEVIGTAETATAAETATGGLETATGVATDGAATQVGGTQATATQASGAATTQTPVVPVTGVDILLVECQFCVDTRAHALLVMPDTATFEIVSPAPSTTTSTTAGAESQCATVEVNNGRQVVLCSGPEMTPLVVNICTDANTCTDFPVDLLACPLAQGGEVGPAQTPGVGATDATPTTGPGVVVSTATPGEGTATATAVP